MKLRAIRVCDVRGFSAPGKAIEGIGDGLNVLAAENEFGKSTLFDAVRAVLFDKHTSTKGAVESLRPYQATGGPTIEVDLETTDGLYRLQKRFLSKRAASVVDLDRGQQVATGSGVNDWLHDVLDGDKPDSGPTGLLWVEQNKSLALPSADGRSGDTLRGLLETAVSDVTGGSQLHAVLAEAKDALAQLITEKTKKPTGRFREVETARQESERRVAELEEDLRALEAKRRNLTDLQRQLADEDKATAQAMRQSELKALTEQIATARQTEERFEGLEKEVRLGEDAVKTKQGELALMRQRQETIKKNSAEAAQIKKDLQTLEMEKQSKHKDVQAAEGDVKQRTKARDEANGVLKAARMGAKNKAIEAQLMTLDQQIAAAKTAAGRLATAEATAESLNIDRARLDDLETKLRARDRAAAKRDAGAAKVQVTYNEGATNKVRVTGQPLAHQEGVTVTGRVELELDTIGRLAIESGSQTNISDLKAEAETAATAFDTARDALGFATVEAARDALDKKTEAKLVADGAREDLKRFAPDGVAALAERRGEIAAQYDTTTVTSEVSEQAAEEGYGAAEAALNHARTLSEALAHDLTTLTQRANEARIRLEGLETQIAQEGAALGDSGTWTQQVQGLEGEIAKASDELAEAKRARDGLQISSDNLQALMEKHQRLEQEIEADNRDVVQLTRQKDVLTGQLSELDREGIGESLSEAQGIFHRTSAEAKSLGAEQRALETLIDSLERAEAHAQNQFFEPVMQELRPLISHVLPDADVVLSRDFSPHEVMRRGIAEPYEGLSGGTREQISILTRLAFARFLARKGRTVPVILDDALVYSDDTRIEKMFHALSQAASDIQLIVLSCRQKTFSGLEGQRLRLQEWTE